MKINAQEIASVDFSKFGRHLRLLDGNMDVLVSEGNGWRDTCTKEALIAAPSQLGRTVGSSVPCVTHTMERHLTTPEVILCADLPIVLPLAPATEENSPKAEDVVAVILRPGDVVVMNPGTWHDACHGLDRPAAYFWLATSSGDSGGPWVEIEGGPLTIAC